jgi:hypothetical protein
VVGEKQKPKAKKSKERKGTDLKIGYHKVLPG